ncbi:hypothetical protein [Pseudoalteromonas sp.]|uniref:hypothetical protein n=1 Tax=Pseudoalteromonas sp. TaxID=53249 RepID=UPI00260D3268|nr:hypothetical protein [Pseudoalteromonas sp.]MCP4057046.1 hypothetical protein [Pseudoalteromonas sp.]MCP4587255.1 hypothetical protein [Pseudoalteromonas sp.]
MWAIISNHRELKFFVGESRSAFAVKGVSYNRVQENGTHDLIVSELLSEGVPLFIKKSDARAKAVEWDLKGFKYIELNPSIIVLKGKEQ